MLRNSACLSACALALSAVATGQTVTVVLSSPQNGRTVAPGATIQWQVDFSVSIGDNEGLALLCCDLTHDPLNPAFFDIPRGNGVPAAMANFSRPTGIANPTEGGQPGYIGVQRGTTGQKNLVQCGGAQNTFGQAMPAGTGVAENATAVGGFGQTSAQTLVAGSFSAPAVPGTYTYSLVNICANVIQDLNGPPLFSPVVDAGIDSSASTISFIVSACISCDANCDGSVNQFDIVPFVNQLTGGSGDCSSCVGDTNDDGTLNAFDIQGFVECLGG